MDEPLYEEIQGGLYTGDATSRAMLNLEFWAELVAYDGATFYAWKEVLPVPGGIFRAVTDFGFGGARVGTFLLNPAFEANGIMAGIGSTVRMSRAYLDPALDWVYVFQCGCP